MKDNEFIELLNLYLDHEISAADAARLEDEVQRDPARRDVYHEYCRLHKGCTLLAADATIHVPAMIEFRPEPRGWFPNAYATVGLVAAACAAFVFFNRGPEVAMGGAVLTENAVPAPAVNAIGESIAASSEVSRNIPRTVTVLARQDGFPPAARTLRLTDSDAAVESVRDLRLTWMDQMQLSSLPQVPVDSLRFETKSPLKTEPRNFGSGPQDAAESAAWQFQR